MTVPDSSRPAYDLIGQALSGLLLADPRPGDTVPRRTGGLALADFTAGLLAALSVTAGLLGRDDDAPGDGGLAAGRGTRAPGTALRVGGWDRRRGGAALRLGVIRRPPGAGAAAARIELAEALDPYYRAHACADGFVALACLNVVQRLRVCELLDLQDPFVDNPQAPPAGDAERDRRAAHVRAVEAGFAGLTVREAVDSLADRRVPASEVRSLDQLFDDPQVTPTGWSRRSTSRASAPCGCSGVRSRWTACRPRRAAPPPASTSTPAS